MQAHYSISCNREQAAATSILFCMEYALPYMKIIILLFVQLLFNFFLLFFYFLVNKQWKWIAFSFMNDETGNKDLNEPEHVWQWGLQWHRKYMYDATGFFKYFKLTWVNCYKHLIAEFGETDSFRVLALDFE